MKLDHNYLRAEKRAIWRGLTSVAKVFSMSRRRLMTISPQSSWTMRVGRLLAALILVVVVVGVGGWFLFRHQKPVTTKQAIELFRAGNDTTTSGRYEVGREPRQKPAGLKKETAARGAGSHPVRSSTRKRSSSTDAAVITATRSPHFDIMPAEGVYLYRGTGREGIGPWNRPLDRDSERIITHHDRDTWTEQHIFSEQRASWTKITIGETGRIVHGQRNDIRIGPNDAINESRQFPFNPPLQATMFPPPSVDETWGGRFSGRTQRNETYTGTYTVRSVEDDVWTIGGTSTRVLGYVMDVELEGDVEGTVKVNYWFSPAYGLTVREDYRIDAKVGHLPPYFGEWSVRLLSLDPRA